MTVLNIYNAEKSVLKRSLVVVAMISILASLCLLVVPLYLTQVYDRVIFARNVDTLLAISLIALVVLIAFGFLDAVRTSLLAKIGIRFEARLSGLLLGAELSRTVGAQRQSMQYLTRIRAAISSPIMTALFDVPVAIIFTLVVFLVHPILGGIVLSGMVVLAIVALVGEVMTVKIMRQAQETSIGVQKREDAAFRQHELVKSMGIFREIVDDWSREQSKHLSAVLVSSVRTNAFASTSRSIRQVIQIAIIGVGAYLVLLDHITPGIIFAASMIGSRAMAPIEQLIAGWRQVNLLRMNFKLLDQRMASLNIADELTPLPRPKGRLVAEGIAFAWPVTAPGQQSHAVLRGISGGMAEGSITGIVGPSGAGKSTFAKCLVGYLTPQRGRVTLDGQDLQAWHPSARGLYIGYLPQDLEFFEGTVRENISRMRHQDDPEFAVDAARFAGVHEAIMKFPSGYDTKLSADGFQPSSGQKQLIALARAFYGNPALAILDEPNAHLDAEGEKMLQHCLRAAKAAGITVVIVTQRMSIMRFVDNVMILKNGAVEQYGPPSQVLQSNNNVRAFPQGKVGA
jgi:PrtD family type I secretion system ABC transporter